jgi:hypothetical protein
MHVSIDLRYRSSKDERKENKKHDEYRNSLLMLLSSYMQRLMPFIFNRNEPPEPNPHSQANPKGVPS